MNQKEKEQNKKREEIKNKKKELLNKYTYNFNTNLNNYVASLKANSKCDEKFKYKEIYENLDISKNGFTNYLTTRLPKNIETIFLIKEYFNVSFSYLFGESSCNEIENIEIGKKYGLNDKSLEILEKITKDSKNDSLEKNYSSTMKLFLLNIIINEEEIFNELSFVLGILIGRAEWQEKYQKINKNLELDDSWLEISKYRTFEKYIKCLEDIVKNKKSIPTIAKYSKDIVCKYGGKEQVAMRNIEKRE